MSSVMLFTHPKPVKFTSEKSNLKRLLCLTTPGDNLEFEQGSKRKQTEKYMQALNH